MMMMLLLLLLTMMRIGEGRESGRHLGESDCSCGECAYTFLRCFCPSPDRTIGTPIPNRQLRTEIVVRTIRYGSRADESSMSSSGRLRHGSRVKSAHQVVEGKIVRFALYRNESACLRSGSLAAELVYRQW